MGCFDGPGPYAGTDATENRELRRELRELTAEVAHLERQLKWWQGRARKLAQDRPTVKRKRG